MDAIRKQDLPALFERLRDFFTQQREFLIELDGKVGDSDLGITMKKAFVAAFESVRVNADDPVGKTLQRVGMAMAKAAPSTMGTLTATGFMRGGKALADAAVVAITTPELAAFWAAFLRGVVERGKAKPGDKTLVDVLGPVVASLESSAQAAVALPHALLLATTVAAQALEATKALVAQHGKAACFQEKSVGVQDGGATVVYFIIDTLRGFVMPHESTP
jgi:dihydroxyacetone kinase-like protein